MLNARNGHVPPIVIEYMLACYYSPTPGEEVGYSWSRPIGAEVRAWLLSNKLITAPPGPPWETYEVTDKGKAWVDMLCATPLPVALWGPPPR